MLNLNIPRFHQLSEILFIYLGGSKNIKNVTNCTSRLRIELLNQSMAAEDSLFLDLKSKGISRLADSIQVIFNTESIILRKNINNILRAFEDKISQHIVSICQNNIENISIKQNQLIITISKDIKLNHELADFLNENNVLTSKNSRSIIFTFSSDYNIDQLENVLIWWDLIQSYTILRVIDIHNIKKIIYQKSLYRIVLKIFIDISEDSFIDCGLPKIYSNKDDNEIQFHLNSKHLFTLLQGHLNLKESLKDQLTIL